MSKQIITNGKYNIVTCSECGCVFAFGKTDIETNANGDKIVTCPQCDKENPSPAKT